jgi:hypothetical protein
VAASVAQYCSDQSYSFGLVNNAVAVYTGRWVNIPLSSSETQIDLVLEALAMVGGYAVTALPEVLRAERDSTPAGTTIALVTAAVTSPLAEEIQEIKDRGYQVIVFYAGDGGPETSLPNVPMYLMGRALEGLEKDEPVLAQ